MIIFSFRRLIHFKFPFRKEKATEEHIAKIEKAIIDVGL